MHSLRKHVALNVARFNRLRRKPPSEILTFMIKRSDQFLMHIWDRLRLIFGEIRLSDAGFFEKMAFDNPDIASLREALASKDFERAKKEITSHMRNRTKPLFYFDRSEKERIVAEIDKHFPESRKRTIELAEQYINHEFSLLGTTIRFDGDIDWHFCENSGKKWPLSFSPNIDYFSSKRLGDIKIPWELNRTQHFVVLGKAYWYTGDERYASEFVNQFVSWIKENPYQRGINWMEGIEAALRVLSWVWAYYYFIDSDEFDEKAHFEFLKSVYVQTRFIEDHLSDKWKINNNHLIAEATAIAVVGIVFPEFKDADRWRKIGPELVERELKSQILPDGVTWEHSTGYQKFVADLCFLVCILMSRNGARVPETISSKLSLMTDFLNRTSKSDRRIPLVGDEDQARVLTLDEAAYDDVGPTTTIASVLLDRKDWLITQSEQAFWLLNTQRLARGSEHLQRTSKLFKDSGFMVMHDQDKFLLFASGPQHARYLHTGHRHLDMLSILLEAYRTYFLVDPGTYTYFGDPERRKYFKSLKAHNSVVVDDKEPVSIDQAFELSHVPFARIQDHMIDSKFDWVAASHNGYKSVNHVRSVFFAKPEYWIVLDILEGEEEHVYDLYFHINSGFDLAMDSVSRSVTVKNSMNGIKISPLVDPGLSSEILEGEISPQYGVKVSAPILRYRRAGKPTAIFLTVLYPYASNEPRIKISRIDIWGKDGRLLNENEAVGAKIELGRFEDQFVCSHVRDQLLSFGNFSERKGRVFYVRKEDSRQINEIVF